MAKRDGILSRDFEASRTQPFELGSAGLVPIISFQPASATPLPAPEETGHERNLFAGHAGSLRNDPIEFGKQLGAWARGTGWRAYSPDMVIGGRVQYPGYSTSTIRAIMSSEGVAVQIRALAHERLATMDLKGLTPKQRQEKLQQLEKQFRASAYATAVALVAKMDSTPFLRAFGAVVNNVLVRLYHQGIHISLEEYGRFRAIAELAASKKQTLLILPCHKSHIDYLTMSWLFYRLGHSLPHIVAGENLNIPVVGSMLAKGGAFFIRRSFGDDSLYSTVVKEYIHHLLEQGMNIEAFIEGTRSRTGKLLPPKLGILRYILEGINEGRTQDVFLCPISVQYDRVLESETYSNELMGNPKEKETLSGLLGSSTVLGLRLGRIDVRFSEPFSLAGFIAEQAEKREPVPLDERSIKKAQGVLLRSLGYRVLERINAAAVVMPAALVGTVLLTIRGRGVGRAELIRRVKTLKSAIVVRGGRVADFAGAEEAVVDRALASLGNKLVGEHKNLIEPIFYPVNRFELSFYRNQVIHVFVADSLLAVVLYTQVKAGGGTTSQRMIRGDIVREIGFLSKLLKNEFVYSTIGLEANANATIARHAKDEVITVEGELVGLSAQERLTGRENFDFYCFLIWPFVETYWLAAVSLFALTPLTAPPAESNVAWYLEKDFQSSAQLLGKSLHAQGDISYLEAVNQATLSNAFQRMIELGVILTRRPTATGQALMALHPAWVPDRFPTGEIKTEGQLWRFLERLGTFRREGKNRRDHSTVSTRVFRSTGQIAPSVVEWTPFTGYEAPISEFWAAKPNL